MAKEKVYKLAQEFRVSSEALVQMLRGMGIPVKSHMSTVDENLRDEIKNRFAQERAEIKREYQRKKQMLAKAREDMMVKAEKSEAVAEQAVAAKTEEKPKGAASTQQTAPEEKPRAQAREERPQRVRNHRQHRPSRRPQTQQSGPSSAKPQQRPSQQRPSQQRP
ncbi:MAG: translation initiation factor IF-2 N-terminal domain-containing protein, partial [Fibrobacterota bacterium]